MKQEVPCPNCGHDESDGNLFFECEWCRRAICSYCHRLTSDMDQICQQCVDRKGLTKEQLEM